MSAEFAWARKVSDIDWSRWSAVDRATLVFVLREGEVLLIEKKRGLGRGKVNAPGGKLDPGETAEQCAIRECREEVRIDVENLEQLGEHRFQFTDGYSIHCWVFRTFDYRGKAGETAEATPLWTPVSEIPFDLMWEDDRLWLPLIIEGRAFTARWVFDDDTMLDYELEKLPSGRKARAGG